MPSALERAIVSQAQSRRPHATWERIASPLLSALRKAGTRHIYADTADIGELGALLSTGGDTIHDELDGSTANQPLVRQIVDRGIDADLPRGWTRELRQAEPELSQPELLPLLYATLTGQVANDTVAAFGSGRRWEISVQLHMDLGRDPERARWIGGLLHRAVPDAFVKVPFRPDAPACILVARDLERAGVPINFTSTFSARQTVVAGLLAGVQRTNIFMGRLNQGLRAELLGEHVDLSAQRALLDLRRERGIPTQLIVASMRDWQSFVRVAGCDVYTAPCSVIREFLAQEEMPPEAIESRLETSYADRLGISREVVERLTPERIARLFAVEPELVQFLCELRDDPQYAALEDGEALYTRFDRAGFGDLFHSPSSEERDELARGKLPELDGALVDRIALDTHFSLLANADFERHQRAIDTALVELLGEGGDTAGASGA